MNDRHKDGGLPTRTTRKRGLETDLERKYSTSRGKWGIEGEWRKEVSRILMGNVINKPKKKVNLWENIIKGIDYKPNPVRQHL